MGRKKVCQCFSCKTKLYIEDAIEERLDDEYSIYFCNSSCKNATSEEELLKEKIYLLYQSIIGTKTLNKTVKGFLRNRLDDEYKDKKNILFSILSEKKEKISRIIAEKTFSNGVARAKYVLKCVENDVLNQYKQQQITKNSDVEEIIPAQTSIIRKIRDISRWL